MVQQACVPWSDVWRTYLEHEQVFGRVVATLRATGLEISRDSALDLVHEFLLTRAPYALATFKPSRGSLPGWLFVVFRRFVLGQYRQGQRARRMLALFEREFAPTAHEVQWEPHADINAVEAAVAGLSSDHRRALHVFFGQHEHGLRAVARALGVSRWKAERIVVEATARIVLELGLDVDLDATDICLVATGADRNSARLPATRPSGRDRSGAQITANVVRGHLARLLGIRSPSHKEHVMTNEQRSGAGATVTCGTKEKLQRFLDAEPVELPHDEARWLLVHATTCEECASSLGQQPAHAEVLLESTHRPVDSDPEAQDTVKRAQEEIRIIGEAVLQHLDDHRIRERMSGKVSREHRLELWTLGDDIPDAEFRAALAVSETTLALQGILASEWDGKAEAIVATRGVDVTGGKHVPASYMSARIADHADVDLGTSLALWRGLVAALVAGKVGLPGLHATRHWDGHVALVPVWEPAEVQMPEYPQDLPRNFGRLRAQ